MKKNLTIMAVLFCLIFTMAFPVGAASQVIQDTETITIVYGDIEVEETLVVYTDLRSNTKSADKTHTVKESGKVIAEVTLSASFGYDGRSSWVESTSSSHTTYSGWSYGSEKISESGGKATLSAMLRKPGSSNTPVNISITCTASGSIS